MANTAAVYARIDTQLKENAEGILAQLGISPSSAIQMLYSQIVLNRGLPFAPCLPGRKPLAIGTLTKDELDAALASGVESLRSGAGVSAEEADSLFAREFGI